MEAIFRDRWKMSKLVVWKWPYEPFI